MSPNELFYYHILFDISEVTYQIFH